MRRFLLLKNYATGKVINKKLKNYNFDIDGTLCTNTFGNYQSAEPNFERIKIVNNLYKDGHKINLFTARGTTTGIDWYELTSQQLKKWGVNYHKLNMGKPEADVYIDDKGINAHDFFESENKSFIDRHIKSLKETLLDLNKIKDIEKTGERIATAFNNGKKILLSGNGGSHSDCLHFAAELTGRFIEDRKPLPAIVLGNNGSSLTAIANDYSYEESFSRELECLGIENDVFFAISTSGTSKNIQKAIEVAKNKSITAILLTSDKYTVKNNYIDICISVKSEETAIIQQIHYLIIHLLCFEIEKNLN